MSAPLLAFRTPIVAAAILALAACPAGAQVVRAGARDCAAVALTFDLSPVQGGSCFDQALVNDLVEHRIPATFFMSGRWIARHDAEVGRPLAVPFFEVGTHGKTHAHLAGQSASAQTAEIAAAAARCFSSVTATARHCSERPTASSTTTACVPRRRSASASSCGTRCPATPTRQSRPRELR